ncbi:MAG: hypothetical protein NVS9B4_26870 [Candidatus Acidiferrum sp.]
MNPFNSWGNIDSVSSGTEPDVGNGIERKMIPENLKYGGGSSASTFTPVGLVLMLIAGIAILLLPRRHAIFAFLFGALFIPFTQNVTVSGIHFQLLRFVTAFALMRVFWSHFVTRKEKAPIDRLHPIDKAFIYFTLASALIFVLFYKDLGSLAFQLGAIYNALGIYFVLRFLIRDQEDVLRAVKALIIVCFVAAVAMFFEQLTGGTNVFGWVGGIPTFDAYRDGHIRAQAFMVHPIIAGSFGATLAPLTVWLWLKKERMFAFLCFFSSIVVTLCSASSTPVMAYGAGLMVFGLWPLRRHMRWVRWGIVFALVFLHIIMKGPVWSLIAHVDIVGGNSADHRYQLVNQCIRHFWDWWLLGTNDNANWGWDMWDTANYYVGTAETGGLLSLILLFTIISRTFRAIGQARAVWETDLQKQLMFWSLGAVLFAQCIAFVGISYFDQTVVAWYGFLAIIVAETSAWAPALAPDVELERGRSTRWAAVRQAVAVRPKGVRGYSLGPNNRRNG